MTQLTKFTNINPVIKQLTLALKCLNLAGDTKI